MPIFRMSSKKASTCCRNSMQTKASRTWPPASPPCGRVGCAKVGVVGYCLGGRLAFLCATRTDSDATVGYYGVGLDNLLGERQNISKPLLLHIATRDKFSPPEAQAKVRAALKDNPLVTIYEYDADHAFARGSGSARVPALAQQADARTQSVFLATSSPEAGLDFKDYLTNSARFLILDDWSSLRSILKARST